jgi:ABC-type lipoprotein export system ATPase subunit
MGAAVTAPLVLDLEGIVAGYGAANPILAGFGMAVAEGERVAITGPSGAGKSTLLNVLGLLARPASGSYRLNGTQTVGLSERERTALRSRAIGFVFQDFRLVAHLDVLANVALGGRYAGMTRRTREVRATELLGGVGLAGKERRRPAELSGGERQRAALARALMGTPNVLLCDEPTGNLDDQTSRAVLSLLWETASAMQAAVVIVTHDERVARQSDREIRLSQGTGARDGDR